MITLSDMFAIIFVLAIMVSLLFFVGRWAKANGVSHESKRKMIHVATGVVAMSFPLLFSGPVPVLFLLALSMLFMLILRTPFVKRLSVSNVLHDVERKSYGEFYLLSAIGFLFARMGDEPVYFILPIMVIALSDTASAIVGVNYGKTQFRIAGGKKSIEGAIAFFMVTVNVSLVVLLLMSDIERVNIIFLAFMIAALCTLVESESWEGLDNLFVPVGAYILLISYQDAAPMQMALAITVLLLATVLMHRSASRLGLSTHSARAISLLIFLFVIGTQNQLPLFQIFAIIAYLIARQSDARANQRRDLAMVAASAATAMIWLFLDGLTPLSAINLYNLNYAAAALIFLSFALPKTLRFTAFAMGLPIWLLYMQIGHRESSDFIGYNHLAFIAASGLAVSLIVATLFPQLFSRYQSVRIFFLSSLPPLVAYATAVF